MTMPIITRLEYELTDIQGDVLMLQDEAGTQKEDLDLPRNQEGEFMQVSEKIVGSFKDIKGDDSRYLSVVVLSAMGKEQAVDCTIKNVA